MTNHTDEIGTALCLAPSKSKWNFMRTWYCSQSVGHGSDVPHQARSEHRPDGEVVWYGPWEDGSYFAVPEGSGIEPWSSHFGSYETST